MKKQLLILSLLALPLAACDSNNNSINNSKFDSSIINVVGTKNETLKELGRQTILGFSSLSNITNLKCAKRNLSESEISEVKNVLEEVDILLNQENKLIVEEINSSKENYKFALSLSFTMLEKEENFTLFYNEIKVHEEIENDDDEKEIEIETSFKGIALHNENEYEFRFSSEEETEDDEKESESSFSLFLNESSFIKIKQDFKVETNENESFYSYTLVENNKKVEEYYFKEEIENNKQHIILEKNNRKYKINYETKDNEELIKVTLKIDNEETAVGYFKRVINSETNVISYEHIELI